jgi:hypothetical protein
VSHLGAELGEAWCGLRRPRRSGTWARVFGRDENGTGKSRTVPFRLPVFSDRFRILRVFFSFKTKTGRLSSVTVSKTGRLFFRSFLRLPFWFGKIPFFIPFRLFGFRPFSSCSILHPEVQYQAKPNYQYTEAGGLNAHKTECLFGGPSWSAPRRAAAGSWLASCKQLAASRQAPK